MSCELSAALQCHMGEFTELPTPAKIPGVSANYCLIINLKQEFFLLKRIVFLAPILSSFFKNILSTKPCSR